MANFFHIHNFWKFLDMEFMEQSLQSFKASAIYLSLQGILPLTLCLPLQLLTAIIKSPFSQMSVSNICNVCKNSLFKFWLLFNWICATASRQPALSAKYILYTHNMVFSLRFTQIIPLNSAICFFSLDSLSWKSYQYTEKRFFCSFIYSFVFPVVTYGCESWIIKKKAECWRTDAFELWCWRRLLWVP